MGKGRGIGHFSQRGTVANRSALHDHDRMVVVAPRGRCGQPYDVPGLHLLHDLLETEGRKVVALVNDDLAVICDDVVHCTLAVEALDEGNVNEMAWTTLPATDFADGFWRDVEQGKQLLPPLVK